MAEFDMTMPNQLGLDTSKIGEFKVHITTCGIPELEHLFAMLEANIAVLPGVVVKAMQALADSVPADTETGATNV